MAAPQLVGSTNHVAFGAIAVLSLLGLLFRVLSESLHTTHFLRPAMLWSSAQTQVPSQHSQPHLLSRDPSNRTSAKNRTVPVSASGTGVLPCEHWAVVSLPGPSLPPPPPWPHWCLLALLDSPPASPPPPRTRVLDPSWHHSCPLALCKLLPWEREARRSLGYLVAIQLGAKTVLDLEVASWLDEALPPEQLEQGLVEVIYPSANVWNPYLHMTDSFTAPPGFPTGQEQDQAVLTSNMEQIPRTLVSIVQPLGGDPGLQTYPLLALALKTLVPCWGGALYTTSSLWSLLLPGSLPSLQARVWRGYMAQPILWLLGRHVALARPWAQWEETEEEENGFGENSEALETLQGLELQCSETGACLLEVWAAMAQAGLLQSSDIALAVAWLKDLSDLGHMLPALPQRRGKDFAYLIQGGRTSSMAKLQRQLNVTATADVLTLSFLDQSGHLYYPNSTHLGGRNALLRYALSLE